MLISRIIYTFSLLSLFCIQTYADSYRMNANYFVRSSSNFNDSGDNKIGVLTKGSTFTVLQKRMLGKAEALQIRVTSLVPPGKVQPSKELWIYKPNEVDFIKMSADAVATEGAATEIPCSDCETAAQKATPTSVKNTGDLADLSRTITTKENTAPADPKPTTEVKPETQAGSYDAAILKYSQSEEVQYSIGYALKHKKSASQGYCYRSVKKALIAAPKGKKGLLSEYIWDQAALMAKNSLKKHGFINLLDSEPYKTQMKSPRNAPKGAVLVYSSGIPCGEKVLDCGHIEIKTDSAGKPGFVSDYYSKDAINETAGARKYGTSYKLVGVMIKP